GYRIETGEIESVLSAHPGVSAAVVVAREDVPGDRRLVASVAAREPGAVTADALRQALRETLPEHMVPSAVVVMESLPAGSTGKVDRAALPAPEYDAAAELHVAPRTPVEETLAEIWADILRLQRVGVHDDFFELGGHSLLATRVVSRVREVFGVELPLKALFAGPTVERLARTVEALRRADGPVLPPVVPVDRDAPLPLSFAQERLWFLSRLEPESAFYNTAVPLRLEGELDAGRLERALGEIVRRHEALRTTFAEEDGSPVQVIAPFAGFTLAVERVAAADEPEREVEVRRRVSEEAARPFDLAEGPLFRATLLRLDAEDHLLLLSMHHVVSDGWSLQIFFRELGALYAAYREGLESPLAELPVQYADYAAWQRAELRGERLDRQLAWWKERLAGAPALLELPADHPRPAVQSYRGALERIALPIELLEGLRRVGRSEGATLYMVLLGAFQVLLGKYCGDDDVVVGTSIAGRTRREVEPLIGFFVNTLALRTDLSGDPGFRRLLRRVREATLGAYEHQDVPFERLVEELQPQRSLSQSPLVQVTFDLHEADIPDGGLAGLRDRAVEAEIRTTKFDLSLDLMVTSHGMAGGLTYSTDLFEAGTIRRMLDHLRRVLEQVAANADVRLSRIGLAGAEERRRVVEEWNQTEVPFPRDACVHQLFEAQVERTPDALAVAWGGRELTYRELDAWANRLAHHLAGLGVRPETRVGVLLERGVEMVAATLAVMKAGGCCVPVDTTYPAERMALMLADSAVRVLLSQGDLHAPLAGAGLHVVRLDADVLAAEPDHPPRAAVSAGNLAYVFYTSGSTGRPKGVMMGHREVVQLAVCIPGTMPMGAGDRVAQASNASFDAAVFEIWGALLHGAALVGVGHDVLLSAPLLARALREGGITHLYQTAALLD
ncbi:MAG TPA: condensation domain-containing protein, partial [Longimicrobium sp.]|nr:condensation domain-containing protein [Longimicrobium sp.]